jgi:hypothetical protein
LEWVVREDDANDADDEIPTHHSRGMVVGERRF